MSVLLIAEHNNKEIRPFTLNAITAASQMNTDVHVLLIGNNCGEVAKLLSEIPVVKKVLHAEANYYENYLAENFAPLVVKVSENYSHIVSSANTFGKNLMPRIAAHLDISQVSDITKVISPDTFIRPIYAGNAFATVKSTDAKKCITIRPTSFEACETSGGSAPIEKVDSSEEFTLSKFVKREEVKSDRPELGTARVVISGGRGMQNGENFKLITDIADKLNAAIGASRAAVDAGYISNEHQVGQTGKVVVPDLYIAVGISGAIQHLAGMKESKIIVAINKDGEAPIFSVADYGLEADLFEALPQFLEELNKLNAAIGASRAAVDAGYISNEHQVGQTGKVVVPDLYIAVGISGAIQHLAGMKESKIIVAINKDGEAPIFSVADYGLEADLFEALPQFLEELNKLNSIQK